AFLDDELAVALGAQELFDGDLPLRLVPDVDDDIVLGDRDDAALDDAAFLDRVLLEAFLEEGREALFSPTAGVQFGHAVLRSSLSTFFDLLSTVAGESRCAR